MDGAFDHRRVRFVGHDGRVAGRFDRLVFVPPPDEGRPETFIGSVGKEMQATAAFDTTVCKPKPIPTESAPATMASPDRSIPAELIATSAARKIPI